MFSTLPRVKFNVLWFGNRHQISDTRSAGSSRLSLSAAGDVAPTLGPTPYYRWSCRWIDWKFVPIGHWILSIRLSSYASALATAIAHALALKLWDAFISQPWTVFVSTWSFRAVFLYGSVPQLKYEWVARPRISSFLSLTHTLCIVVCMIAWPIPSTTMVSTLPRKSAMRFRSNEPEKRLGTSETKRQWHAKATLLIQ